MKKIYFSLIFLIFSINFIGCDVVPFVGPIVSGVIMWKNGEGHKYYYEEPATLYHSTKLALKELNHSISIDKIQKNGDYYILAGKKDEFKIYIRKVEPHISEVNIRINFMGNKPYAELIYKFIDSNVNTIEFNQEGKITKTNNF